MLPTQSTEDKLLWLEKTMATNQLHFEPRPTSRITYADKVKKTTKPVVHAGAIPAVSLTTATPKVAPPAGAKTQPKAQAPKTTFSKKKSPRLPFNLAWIPQAVKAKIKEAPATEEAKEHLLKVFCDLDQARRALKPYPMPSAKLMQRKWRGGSFENCPQSKKLEYAVGIVGDI